jgi:hypothetical protein
VSSAVIIYPNEVAAAQSIVPRYSSSTADAKAEANLVMPEVALRSAMPR